MRASRSTTEYELTLTHCLEYILYGHRTVWYGKRNAWYETFVESERAARE